MYEVDPRSGQLPPPPSVLAFDHALPKRIRHGARRLNAQSHGWAGSSATAASLRSFAAAFLISLCIHAALVIAAWRFASTQQRQTAQREMRIELTSSPRPLAVAVSEPVHSETRLDSSERKVKGRSDRLARAHASAAQPATKSPGSAASGSSASSPVVDAPPEAELRQPQENTRPIDLRVVDWLARYRTYPLEARRARIEGVVQLRVTLMSDGRLVDARVEQSSGHLLLDRAALELLARASPLPDEFASERLGQIELQLPIVYRMRAPSS